MKKIAATGAKTLAPVVVSFLAADVRLVNLHFAGQWGHAVGAGASDAVLKAACDVVANGPFVRHSRQTRDCLPNLCEVSACHVISRTLDDP